MLTGIDPTPISAISGAATASAMAAGQRRTAGLMLVRAAEVTVVVMAQASDPAIWLRIGQGTVNAQAFDYRDTTLVCGELLHPRLVSRCGDCRDLSAARQPSPDHRHHRRDHRSRTDHHRF